MKSNAIVLKCEKAKWFKYLQGNKTIDKISIVSILIALSLAVNICLAALLLPAFIKQYPILDVIAIIMMFLAAIGYLIQAIIHSNVPKKFRFSIAFTIYWILLGVFNIFF